MNLTKKQTLYEMLDKLCVIDMDWNEFNKTYDTTKIVDLISLVDNIMLNNDNKAISLLVLALIKESLEDTTK